MITRNEAKLLLEKELQDQNRIGHSISVAETMEAIARQLKAEPELWYLTGLLHDIDLPETIDNLKMHGIVAKDKLMGLLPPTAIRAIMSHDYRTGIPATTKLAKALVFADSLENIGASIGKEKIDACRRQNSWEELRAQFPNKKLHIDVLEGYIKQWPGITI